MSVSVVHTHTGHTFNLEVDSQGPKCVQLHGDLHHLLHTQAQPAIPQQVPTCAHRLRGGEVQLSHVQVKGDGVGGCRGRDQ